MSLLHLVVKVVPMWPFDHFCRKNHLCLRDRFGLKGLLPSYIDLFMLIIVTSDHDGGLGERCPDILGDRLKVMRVERHNDWDSCCVVHADAGCVAFGYHNLLAIECFDISSDDVEGPRFLGPLLDLFKAPSTDSLKSFDNA